MPDEDANVKKERREKKMYKWRTWEMDGAAEGKRWRRVLCQLLLHEDDRRVCVLYFLAGLVLGR